MKTSEALRGGAEYIGKNGHFKGSLIDGDGSVLDRALAGAPACLIGSAIAHMELSDAYDHDIVDRIYGAHYNLYDTPAPVFNDAQSTTASDAIIRMNQLANHFEELGD